MEKNNDGNLTITDADNDGSLTADGGEFGAGIGGGYMGSGSNITISGSNITISGGRISATGGRFGAGIGGGYIGSGSNITITGGTIKAAGGISGAGIGGGYHGGGDGITVSGDAQLKVQGGKEDDHKVFVYGAGEPIGNGGNHGSSGAGVLDVKELTAKGEIKYYAPGVDMENSSYTKRIVGTHVHDFDDGVVTTLPTCTKKGVMTYTCKAGNNFVVTEEIPPQHDYGTPEVWKYNEEEHYKVCQRTSCSDIPGSIKERAAHTYESKTSQVCTVCKYDRGHQHSLTLVSKKEASCTEAGHEAYYTCSGCDSLFADDFGAVAVSLEKLTIPATGHKYDGDTCTICGYQKPETSTTRSSGGSHHDSAEVTDNSQKGRWVQDEKGWYFRRNDGSYPKSGWSKLYWLGKEYWYYFDENGYMKLGWLDVNGSRYYMNPVIGTNSGKMLTGWQQIDQKWYYFSTETGAKEGSLLRNTVTPDNYTVDENGIWQQ